MSDPPQRRSSTRCAVRDRAAYAVLIPPCLNAASALQLQKLH